MTLQTNEAAYQQLAENPDRWMSSARNLLMASDILWESVAADIAARSTPTDPGGDHADVSVSRGPCGRPFLQHASAYLMLAGFAIENGLKAVRVKQDKRNVMRIRPGALELSKTVKTHDLEKLAATAGIALSQSETELLQRLEAFLVWAGRYPVATTAAGQAVVQNIWQSDQADVHTMFDRLVSEFHAV